VFAAPAGCRLAVETRNPNDLSQESFDLLGEHRLGCVFKKGYRTPPIGSVFSRCDSVTTDYAVIRLHGGDRQEVEERTSSVWNAVVDRRLEGLAAAARIVPENARREIMSFVNVNNHYERSAPLTIGWFCEVLDREERTVVFQAGRRIRDTRWGTRAASLSERAPATRPPFRL
jgi:hypothetical protein